MDWFKQELAKLQLEEQRLKNEMLKLELQDKQKEEEEEDNDWYDDDCCEDDDYEDESFSAPGEYEYYTKPYENLKMVNDVLTIVLNDGNIITKTNASYDDFKTAQNARTEAELFNLAMSQEAREEKRVYEADLAKARAIQAGLEKLKTINDFIVKEDGSVYLKGISRSLPQILVEEFLTIIGTYDNLGWIPGGINDCLQSNESYQALKRFFMWCCLNPRAEVAHELYRFLKENSFRITKQGFFVALRNVVSLCDDTELVDFVSNSYNKIKAIWKKDPSQYTVVRKDGQLSLVTDVVNFEGFVEGNLTQLYLNLPEMRNNRYTDDWTKTFDIRVGRPVSMPMNDCNWSTQDCAAAGLHFTADQIHYVGCGDTSMLILINPMKVVGIGQHKGRCYEYLPLMTVPREEATKILHDLDFDTLELDDQYAIRELEGLADRAQAGFVVESRKYTFNIPNISQAEIRNIALSLDDMRSEIRNRVSSI